MYSHLVAMFGIAPQSRNGLVSKHRCHIAQYFYCVYRMSKRKKKRKLLAVEYLFTIEKDDSYAFYMAFESTQCEAETYRELADSGLSENRIFELKDTTMSSFPKRNS